MIRFQPFGQVMSIADTGASAGTTKSWVASCISSRSGMEPGCGKKLHVSKFGVRRLYTRLFERDFPVVYGNAFFDSKGKNDGLHPTRASERGRAKGRPDDTLEQVFKPDNRVSTSSRIFEFRSVAIARHLSSGHLFSCLEPHHLFAMRFKILLWMLILRPSAVAGSGSKHSHGRDSYH